MTSFVVAHGNVHAKHYTMPKSLELSLNQAKRESGVPVAGKLVDALPRLMEESGWDAYMGGLAALRRVLTKWKSLDGKACRREICRVLRMGTSKSYEELLRDRLINGPIMRPTVVYTGVPLTVIPEPWRG